MKNFLAAIGALAVILVAAGAALSPAYLQYHAVNAQIDARNEKSYQQTLLTDAYWRGYFQASLDQLNARAKR